MEQMMECLLAKMDANLIEMKGEMRAGKKTLKRRNAGQDGNQPRKDECQNRRQSRKDGSQERRQ
jgi:hypothetical protein